VVATDDVQVGSRYRLPVLVRAEWTELGPLGRTSLIALLVAAIAAVVLAFAIPRQVEHFLIESEAGALERVVTNLAAQGLIPEAGESQVAAAELDSAIQRDLLGRDTVRVKIWNAEGLVLYSDAPKITGQRFPLSDDVNAALAGEARTEIPDLSRPENVAERELGNLREYYIPVRGRNGEVSSVFEVYVLADPMLATVGNIRQAVWISIGIGIALLTIFLLALISNHARGVTRRRRESEQLLRELLQAADDERARIVGALHDDIGQPLYRIHYGIEDLLARVDPEDPIADDLARVGEIIQQVDGHLRTELRTLQDEPGAELDVVDAIGELAETTEAETNLRVNVVADRNCPLPPTHRVILYRAAKEGVTNVRKHAYATRIDIAVYRRGDRVVLDVADDGSGIADKPGLGLTTTRERLESLGGGLRVQQPRSGGTRLRVWVPAIGCDDE